MAAARGKRRPRGLQDAPRALRPGVALLLFAVVPVLFQLFEAGGRLILERLSQLFRDLRGTLCGLEGVLKGDSEVRIQRKLFTQFLVQFLLNCS